MEVQGSGRHLLGNGNYPRRREEREGVRAKRLPCQFTGSGQALLSVQGAKHNGYMLLPGLRRAKGAVCSQYSGFLSETGR